MVLLDIIVFVLLKDFLYYKKKKKNLFIYKYRYVVFFKKRKEKNFKREGGINRKYEVELMRGDSLFLFGEGY